MRDAVPFIMMVNHVAVRIPLEALVIYTTVGYLLGESEQENFLKDPEMLKGLNDIQQMKPEEKGHVLFTLDALIQKIKLKNIAAL